MASDNISKYEAFSQPISLGVMATPSFVFPGQNGQPAVTITFDPPHIELAPGIDWDGAAKMFWNAVAKLAGQEPPFGW
jgi:hypothetical protein